MQLGQKIKEHRLKQNLKASALAKKAKITRSYISHIERGNTVPSLKVLEKIANALNCSVTDLLTSNPESEESPPCEDSSSDTPAR